MSKQLEELACFLRRDADSISNANSVDAALLRIIASCVERAAAIPELTAPHQPTARTLVDEDGGINHNPAPVSNAAIQADNIKLLRRANQAKDAELRRVHIQLLNAKDKVRRAGGLLDNAYSSKGRYEHDVVLEVHGILNSGPSAQRRSRRQGNH